MRLKLIYSPDVVEKPILATIILKTGLQVNILEAKVNEQKGELVISVPAEDDMLQKVIKMFKDSGVNVQVLTKTLNIDRDKCVACGACISPCPTKAIRFTADWSIEFDEEKCVACRVCVKACPMQAIKVL